MPDSTAPIATPARVSCTGLAAPRPAEPIEVDDDGRDEGPGEGEPEVARRAP